MEQEMEKKNIGMFSMLTYEDYEWDECVSAWDSEHCDKLETRKYAANFNPKYFEVKDWVYAHRKVIENLTLEQQEEMMIKDGVLTRDDI